MPKLKRITFGPEVLETLSKLPVPITTAESVLTRSDLILSQQIGVRPHNADELSYRVAGAILSSTEKRRRVNDEREDQLSLSCFVTAHDILQYNPSCFEHLDECLLSTGSVAVDAMIGGGLLRGGVTEVSGPSSSGKTQLCLTIALLAASGQRKTSTAAATASATAAIASTAAHNCNVLYIDTSNSFCPRRMRDIATHIHTTTNNNSNDNSTNANQPDRPDGLAFDRKLFLKAMGRIRVCRPGSVFDLLQVLSQALALPLSLPVGGEGTAVGDGPGGGYSSDGMGLDSPRWWSGCVLIIIDDVPSLLQPLLPAHHQQQHQRTKHSRNSNQNHHHHHQQQQSQQDVRRGGTGGGSGAAQYYAHLNRLGSLLCQLSSKHPRLAVLATNHTLPRHDNKGHSKGHGQGEVCVGFERYQQRTALTRAWDYALAVRVGLAVNGSIDGCSGGGGAGAAPVSATAMPNDGIGSRATATEATITGTTGVAAAAVKVRGLCTLHKHYRLEAGNSYPCVPYQVSANGFS